MVSFAMQKLKFYYVLLIYFCFYFFYLRRHMQKKYCYNLRQCSTYLFSRSFMGFDLIYRCLIHFEFIFVYGVRKYPDFIMLHIFPELIRDCLFFTVYAHLLCCRLIDQKCVDLFIYFYPIPLICISVFVPVPFCFDYGSFVVNQWLIIFFLWYICLILVWRWCWLCRMSLEVFFPLQFFGIVWER